MQKSNYTITIRMNGLEYKSKGETLNDAFISLGFDYRTPKTKAEVIIKKGKNEATRIFVLQEFRRILASKMRMIGIIRDFERLLV